MPHDKEIPIWTQISKFPRGLGKRYSKTGKDSFFTAYEFYKKSVNRLKNSKLKKQEEKEEEEEERN